MVLYSSVKDIREYNNYPNKLVNSINLSEPLHYFGSINDSLFKYTLAVIGSRKLTPYGIRVINEIVPILASLGITIVSGFMRGADQVAHEACINAKGKTIAVLGTGFGKNFTSHKNTLLTDIKANGGLILSQFDKEFAGSTWSYPKRNQIVIKMSDAIFVVEAEQNSGSEKTAIEAYKANKKVFVAPGSMFSSCSKGTLDLAKTGKAEIITSANDILNCFKEIGFKGAINLENNTKTATNSQTKIIDSLSAIPQDFDTLFAQFENIGQKKFSATISQLEILGHITKKEGKYHVA